MSFHSWLQHLRSTLARRPDQRRHRRRGSLRAATHRPSLEVLEDRLTPSFTWSGSDQYPTNAEPAQPTPVLADFTGDGIPDRLTTDSNYVFVQPGRGDGTFGNAIISYGPTGLGGVVDDFNGDGRLDLYTISSLSASAVLLLGRGDGSFYEEENVPLPSFTDYGYESGDFNGDGRPDVAIAAFDDYSGEPLGISVGLNDGNWPPPPPPPVPSITIHDSTVAEGNTGTVAATFSLTLSAASAQTITVAYATADGTATAGSDYQAASGTLTFAPGETSKTITVQVNGDRLPEPNETFTVNLSGATNATVARGQGTGTILDDEPHISISDVSKKEGKKTQTTQFTFTVTLSAAYDQPVTMSFRTMDGTARTSDNDYVAKNGTITFNPGETTKTITIQVKGDSKKEANETFYLDLFSNSGNSLFTKNRGLGTILNDD
jgi:hypothetical protein